MNEILLAVSLFAATISIVQSIRVTRLVNDDSWRITRVSNRLDHVERRLKILDDEHRELVRYVLGKGEGS